MVKKIEKRISIEDKNKVGGSPAYRLIGQQGLLNQSSLDYNQLQLGLTQNGFSNHIVSTTGGGMASKSKRLSKSKR